MARSIIDLDRQAKAQSFSFGTTSASGQGLVTVNNGTAAASNVVLDVKGSQSIAGDLNLTGNLNITGAINETSVTNLNVSDLTIRVNDGGTTAGATGAAGMLVEGDTDTIIGALIFDNSLTSKWKIGATAAGAVEVVTTSGTQTLTNKTIAGTQITGNISGNAANVTGTVVIGNGGTGATTKAGAFDALSPMTTAGDIIYGGAAGTGTRLAAGSATQVLHGGSTPSWGAVSLTADVSGILPGANGGTGNGFTAFSGPTTALKTFTLPNASATILTDNAAVTAAQGGTGQTGYTVGDLLYASGASALSKLAGNITTTKQFLTQTGGGSASAAPAWGTISANDVPNLENHNGTLTVAKGGTGVQTLPSNNVLIGNGTSNVTGVAPGSSGNVLVSNGTNWTSAAPTTGKTFTRTTWTGTQNGSNTAFTIGVTPNPAGSEQIFFNGQLLLPGSGNDYTISGTAVTMLFAPASTDQFQVFASS